MHVRDDETDDRLTNRQLRNETITMLLAGHETTANALTWTWHLLGQHPAAADLRAEVRAVLGDRPPTFDDLAKLTYTRMVLQESMRLYPPIWIMERHVREADEIAGYRIPAGTSVVVSPYVTHRHPDFWNEPEIFKPERFTPEATEQRPQLAYFPFGAGLPRPESILHLALLTGKNILTYFSCMVTSARKPDVFAAISHPARRHMLDLLAAADQPVNAIAGHFQMSRPAVSQHLRILLDVGLVTEQRHGRQRRYHFVPQRLGPVRDWIARYEKFWDDRLRRLQKVLAKKSKT